MCVCVGGSPLRKEICRHFEKKKYLHAMVLKLTAIVFIRITITLLYKQIQLRFRYYIELLWQKFEFSSTFRKNRYFETGNIIWCHNYVTSWLIVMILICIDIIEETLTYILCMVLNNTTYGCQYHDYRQVTTNSPLPSDNMLQKVAQVDEG